MRSTRRSQQFTLVGHHPPLRKPYQPSAELDAMPTLLPTSVLWAILAICDHDERLAVEVDPQRASGGA
jgi:hypothetical protein